MITIELPSTMFWCYHPYPGKVIYKTKAGKLTTQYHKSRKIFGIYIKENHIQTSGTFSGIVTGKLEKGNWLLKEGELYRGQ